MLLNICVCLIFSDVSESVRGSPHNDIMLLIFLRFTVSRLFQKSFLFLSLPVFFVFVVVLLAPVTFFFLVVRASPFFFLLLCLLSSDPFPHFPLTPLFYVSVLRFPTLYICVFLPLLVSNCSSFFTSSPYSLKWKLRFLPFLFSLSMFAAVMVNNTNSNIYVFFFFHGLTRDRLCYASSLPLRCGTEAKSIL